MARGTYLLSFPDASESTHRVERLGDSPFARIDRVRGVWLLARVTKVGYEDKYVDGTLVHAKAWVRRATDEELVTLAGPTAAPAG